MPKIKRISISFLLYAYIGKCTQNINSTGYANGAEKNDFDINFR